MRLNVAVPEAHVSAPILDAALEATTRLDQSLLKSGELEPYDMAAPGVRWRPEPPGDEHFDHGMLVTGRGWGDCDDLAPWHAASLRVTGEDRGAKAFVRPSGPGRWHALVRRSDGRVDDPSLAAGMPGRGAQGVRGAMQPPMLRPSSVVGGTYIARPQLALRPVVDQLSNEIEAWQARTDLPWHASPGRSPSDIAMVSLHASPISSQALVGALEGAVLVGRCNGANPEHLDRLRCVSDMVQGATWEDCAEVYGDEHADAASAVVGSFFKKLFKPKNLLRTLINPLRLLPGGKMLDPENIIKSKMMRGMVSKGLQFIPGVGPIASSAFDTAAPMLQKMLSRGEHRRPPEYGPPPPQYPQYPQYPQEAPAYAPPYPPGPPGFNPGASPWGGGAALRMPWEGFGG